MADLFLRFSMHSGLKVNIAKSKAYFSSGKKRDKRAKMTAITSIHQSASLERYLGFPILTGRAWKEDFHFILEKLQTRLSSWKTKLLTKVGKLTLAKSVLNSIPVYYMQI